MEFECETSLMAKTPETHQHFFSFLFFPVSLWFARAYQIFERMTSFFFIFFRTDTNYTESRRDVEY